MSRKDDRGDGASVPRGNSESTFPGSLHSKAAGGLAVDKKARLFDSSIVGTPQEAVDFITNILESSTEYSVIAKDLTGKILLWNEGARRLYGYEPGDVIGKANSSILHTPEDINAGVPGQIMQAALQHVFQKKTEHHE
jgi:PAS domain-containing protein